MELQVEQTPKKPLSKSEQELLNKLVLGKYPEIVKNPFSQQSVLLPPKAVALYDYIKGYELLISAGKEKNIQNFDRARMLFMKLYPDAYMDLLD